jgi:hypothetical protein
VPLDVLTPAGRNAVGRVRSSCLQELAADPPVVAVRPTTCSQARLQKAMGHAVIAAASYYQTGDDQAPEQYRQDLEGVEVKRTDVVELVLSTNEQLRSVRKTADKFGLN